MCTLVSHYIFTKVLKIYEYKTFFAFFFTHNEKIGSLQAKELSRRSGGHAIHNTIINTMYISNFTTYMSHI